VITIAYLGFVLGPAAVGLVAGAATLSVALGSVSALAGLLAIASPLLRSSAGQARTRSGWTVEDRDVGAQE
jgi:hypothetical protein